MYYWVAEMKKKNERRRVARRGATRANIYSYNTIQYYYKFVRDGTETANYAESTPKCYIIKI